MTSRMRNSPRTTVPGSSAAIAYSTLGAADFTSPWPQRSQNLASSGAAWPHSGQVIITLVLGRLALSKLQFSAAEHHLVAILELVELVAAEPPAAGDIGAVKAAEIADEVVGAVLNDLGVAARHAVVAALECPEIDIRHLAVQRPSDYRAALNQSETRGVPDRGSPCAR